MWKFQDASDEAKRISALFGVDVSFPKCFCDEATEFMARLEAEESAAMFGIA